MSENTESQTAEVLTEVQGNVLVITLNRPEAKNAATQNMAQMMAQILDHFDANDDLFVAVITGAGKTFCAGMDLKGFLRGERPSIDGRGFLSLTEAPPKSRSSQQSRATRWPEGSRRCSRAIWSSRRTQRSSARPR